MTRPLDPTGLEAAEAAKPGPVETLVPRVLRAYLDTVPSDLSSPDESNSTTTTRDTVPSGDLGAATTDAPVAEPDGQARADHSSPAPSTVERLARYWFSVGYSAESAERAWQEAPEPVRNAYLSNARRCLEELALDTAPVQEEDREVRCDLYHDLPPELLAALKDPSTELPGEARTYELVGQWVRAVHGQEGDRCEQELVEAAEPFTVDGGVGASGDDLDRLRAAVDRFKVEYACSVCGREVEDPDKLTHDACAMRRDRLRVLVTAAGELLHDLDPDDLQPRPGDDADVQSYVNVGQLRRLKSTLKSFEETPDA